MYGRARFDGGYAGGTSSARDPASLTPRASRAIWTTAEIMASERTDDDGAMPARPHGLGIRRTNSL